jgi:mono/diheme cytochrome c family protein
MKHNTFTSSLVLLGLLSLQLACLSSSMAADKKKNPLIERGKYLVTVGGCHDCHTAKVYGPAGPALDTTRLLAGHPADSKLPAAPTSDIGPNKWMAATNEHLSAWVGPWGVSFARNLTPDVETGIGSWTEAIFIKALRTGKDMGEGRDILPPMPWQNFAQMTDADLKAIFAYLKSLTPVHNPIPDPIPPATMDKH